MSGPIVMALRAVGVSVDREPDNAWVRSVTRVGWHVVLRQADQALADFDCDHAVDFRNMLRVNGASEAAEAVDRCIDAMRTERELKVDW